VKTLYNAFLLTTSLVFGCYDFSISKSNGASGASGTDAEIVGTETVFGGDSNPIDSSGNGRGAAGTTSSIPEQTAGGPSITGQSQAGSAAEANASSSGAGDSPSEPCSSENALRCSNKGAGQREQCREGLWQLAETCKTGEICSSQSGEKQGSCQELAAVCQGSAGKPVCDGQGIMYQCDDDGAIQSQQKCLSARHCQVGLTNGTCPACIPGEFRCTGKQLEACKTDGSDFTTSKSCDTAALCKAEAGDCTASACVANKLVCEGDSLRKCNADQTALVDDQECDPGLCDNVAGECDICTPGEKKCEGDTVLTCDSKGQNYTRKSCSGGTAHCIGSGQCVACTQDSECPAPGTCKQRYCNTAKGTCEPQNAPNHESCSAGVCSSGNCLGCIDSSDCNSGGKTICDTGRRICVECINSSTCPYGTSCSNSKCVDNCGNKQLDSGETCDPTVNTTNSNPYNCDSKCKTQTLYTKTPSNGYCMNNTVAGALGYCAPRCETTSDCPKPTGKDRPECNKPTDSSGTNYPGYCVLMCSQQSDCPTSMSCSNSGSLNNCFI
jgi:hypothetical protein